MTGGAIQIVELFKVCNSINLSGMGGLSVNLTHLPHPGGIMQQRFKLMRCFDVIKHALYSQQRKLNG